MLDVISGTIWFVYLQKCGFRVVNCFFFLARGIGSLSSKRMTAVADLSEAQPCNETVDFLRLLYFKF